MSPSYLTAQAQGQMNVTGGYKPPSIDLSDSPWGLPSSPMQTPGNNLTNPGYAEQAFEYTQNRLLEDPYAKQLGAAYNNTQKPSAGENYLNQNLGSLNGPGQGEQYWNQVQGQYMDPFAGEQFARQATQNFQAQGPASAFNQQAMGDHYQNYTNYSTGNAQGQYGQSSGQGLRLPGGGADQNKEKRGNTPPGSDRAGDKPAAGAIVDPGGVTKK